MAVTAARASVVLRRLFSSKLKQGPPESTDIERRRWQEAQNRKIESLLNTPEIIDYDKPFDFKGNLILCPTPIGNLKDLSFRALEAITTADLIACEDTRTTGKLIALIKERKFEERLDEVMRREAKFSLSEDRNGEEDVFKEFVESRLKQTYLHPNELTVKRTKSQIRDFNQKLEIAETQRKAERIIASGDTLGFLNKYDKEGEEDRKESRDDDSFYDTHSETRKKNKEKRENELFDDEFISFIKRKVEESKLKKGRGLLLSCHRFNEEQRIESLVRCLKAGMRVVLVPDAGSPCLSDPGQMVVNQAIRNKISIESLPGPNSVVLALTSSGFPANSFSFMSFWPKNEKEEKQAIEAIKRDQKTTVFFENKHRIMSTLAVIERELGRRQFVFVAVEMTKLHERLLRGTVSDVYETLNKNPDYTVPSLKGELTVVVAPFAKEFNSDIVNSEDIVSGRQSLTSDSKLATEPPNQVPIDLNKLITTLNDNVQMSTKEMAILLRKVVKMPKKQLYERIVKAKKLKGEETEDEMSD